MQFVMESRIAATPEAVFAFHERPGTLLRLTPPWERVEVERDDGSIEVGSRVVIRTWLGPFPIQWVADHVEYDPPRGFVDVQVSGPFKAWRHAHSFLDDGAGGCLLRDEVDFVPPFGWLGRVAGGSFLRRKLSRMFRYRHDITRRAVEPFGLGTPQLDSTGKV